MAIPAERKNARLMRKMFAAIAPRYDFVTRVFSYGMDRRWKAQGLERLRMDRSARVLDLAAGTGDFSRLLIERLPGVRVVAADLTEAMLCAARQRGIRDVVCGDAMALPFANGRFDCVFVGYGLRNFPDLPGALREIGRVTRPGGQILTLDFFLPENRTFRACYLAYLYVQGAFWGWMLHANARTYTYIAASLKSFLSIRELTAALERAGYKRAESQSFIFGGIGLHWAVKSEEATRLRIPPWRKDDEIALNRDS